MANLTGTKIANTYKQLLQIGSNNTGISGTVQTVQDGSGTNSPLQLSNSAVNINGTFQLSGVTLTANASTLNAVADLTGATGIVAVSAGNVYGRTITGGAGVSITNADGTEGNPTIALNTTGVTSASYGPATNIEINSVGQIVSAGAATSVSVSGVTANTFTGGTFAGTTGDFSSNVSVGGNLVLAGQFSPESISVTGAINANKISATDATFNNIVSAGFFVGDGSGLVNLPSAEGGTVKTLEAGTGITLYVNAGVTSTVNVSGTIAVSANQNFGTVSVSTALAVSGTFTSPGIDDNATSTALTISSADNVGVGTATPDRLFEVDEASGDAYMRLRASDTGGSADTVFENLVADNAQNNFIYFGDLDDTNIGIIRYSHASDFMSFTTNTAERMRIDSSGDVGIGVSTASGKLHLSNSGAVNEAATIFSLDGYDSTFGANLAKSSGTYTTPATNISGGGWEYQAANNLNNHGEMIYLSAPDTNTSAATPLERLRIDSSGNVGIGTSSPASTLTVSDGSASGLTPFGGTDLFLDSSSSNYLQFGSGTSSSPAIYFGDSADGDVGGIIYAHASNAMSFRTNAAERMRIDSSGNVGIGTTSPAVPLHISSASPAIRLTDTDDNSDAQVGAAAGGLLVLDADINNEVAGTAMLFRVDGGSEKMRIDSSGNVGIGTTSPANPLHVVGEGTFTRGLELGINGVDATCYISQYRSTVETLMGPLTTRMLFGTVSNHDIAIQTNNTEVMRVGSSGNVGIGTSSPATELDVNGTVTANGLAVDTNTLYVDSVNNRVGVRTASPLAPFEVSTGFADYRIMLTNSSGLNEIRSTESDQTTYTTLRYDASAHIFENSNTETMRIISSGNVGIGTSSPSYKLHISNGSSTGTAMQLQTTGSGHNFDMVDGTGTARFRNVNGEMRLYGDLNSGGNGNIVFLPQGTTERMRIDSSGNVGINASNPGEKLTVSGNMQIVGSYSDFSDYWGSGSNSAFFLPYGFVGSSGGFKLSLYANGYRNSSSSFTYMDINGNTNTAAGIDLNVTGEISFSTGTASGTALPVRMTIDSSGNVGIGTSSPAEELHVYSDSAPVVLVEAAAGNDSRLRLLTPNDRIGYIEFGDSDDGDTGEIRYDHSTNHMGFHTNGNVERMRITASGNVGIGNSAPAGPFEVLDVNIGGSSGEDGFSVGSSGRLNTSTDDAIAWYMNDSSASAGTHNYIVFRYQGSTIGDIDTTDNSTIRYQTFTGAHWSQFTDHSQPEIPLGTVMSTINEMLNWTQFEYVDADGLTQKTDIAGTYDIGSTHTIYIDEDGGQAEGTAIAHDTSKRIAKVKVSDTAGDKSVYGVFAGHYKDGDSSVESLGLGAIRVGSGVTVANGDLLESAGDGTARPQTGDNADLFKASTIAKVTSTTVVETYDDGSYTVPCTLHCG